MDSSASYHPTSMTDPPDSENEGLHTVLRDEPDEKLLQDAIPRVEPQQLHEDLESSDRERFSSISLFTFLGGFIFVLLAVLAAYIYLIQPKPVRRLPALDDQAPAASRSPEASQQSTPPATLLRSARPPAEDVKLREDLPITADMLHVTAVALGNIHLAIVNGQRLAEGDWLKVKVGNDMGALQVAKIEDGVVHFNYAGRTINAKLISPSKPKPKH
jgi:hypothetical protein